MKKKNKPQKNIEAGVDKELIAMFLRMTPEERIQANDTTIRTIMELRDAIKRAKASDHGPQRTD